MNEIIDYIKSHSKIEGASISEINSIEKIINVKLPNSYILFLKNMGRRASFLKGESCFIADIPDLRISAINTLKGDNFQFELTDDIFVFSSMQGITYWFFKLNEGDNPPVYYFMEGRGQKVPIKVADSFSEYLLKKLNYDPSLFPDIDLNTQQNDRKQNDLEINVEDELPF